MTMFHCYPPMTKLTLFIMLMESITLTPAPASTPLVMFLFYYSSSETREQHSDKENLLKTKNNVAHGDSYMVLRDGCLMDRAASVPNHRPKPSGIHDRLVQNSQTFLLDFNHSAESTPISSCWALEGLNCSWKLKNFLPPGLAIFQTDNWSEIEVSLMHFLIIYEDSTAKALFSKCCC